MTHTQSTGVRGAFGVVAVATVLVVSGCAGSAAGVGSDKPTAAPTTEESTGAAGSESAAGLPRAADDPGRSR